MRRMPRTVLEAGDHLPLEGQLIPRLAQSALRQVRHVRRGDGDGMRSSEDGAACPSALVIGEGENGRAFVRDSPRCGDSAAFLVRELSDGSGVQLGADEKQLSANTFVMLLDAISAMPRDDADIRDFEDAEFHGWHASRVDESRLAAERQRSGHSETVRRPGSVEIIRASAARSSKNDTCPPKFANGQEVGGLQTRSAIAE
jgi:hypothetical protein